MKVTNTTVLIGRKAICDYCKRSWDVIKRWVDEKRFPARKIDDVWESDTSLIDEWRREQIRGGLMAPRGGPFV